MRTQPITFDAFCAAVLALYSTGRHAPATRTRMIQVLRELGALGPATTADLTTGLMARYVASRGPTANANTTNGLLSAAAAACSYAVEEGFLGHPPAWRRVRPRPTRPIRNQPRRYEEVARLLDHLRAHRGDGWERHRLCAVVWALALTGLRRDECLRLRVDQVDLGDRPSVAIAPPGDVRRRLKTEGSERRVPLPDALAVVLRDWMPLAGPVWLFPGLRRKGPWTGGSIAGRALGAIQRAATAAGIPRLTIHSLRHAFGTYAIERWGVPLWVLQRVMGHTDPRTTALYVHLDQSPAIADAVRGIAYVPGG